MLEDVFSYIDQLCEDLDVSADSSDLVMFDLEHYTRIFFYSSKGTKFSLLFSENGLELGNMGHIVTLQKDFGLSLPSGLFVQPILEGVEKSFSVKYDVIVVNRKDLVPILKEVISKVDLLTVVPR